MGILCLKYVNGQWHTLAPLLYFESDKKTTYFEDFQQHYQAIYFLHSLDSGNNGLKVIWHSCSLNAFRIASVATATTTTITTLDPFIAFSFYTYYIYRPARMCQ